MEPGVKVWRGCSCSREACSSCVDLMTSSSSSLPRPSRVNSSRFRFTRILVPRNTRSIRSAYCDGRAPGSALCQPPATPSEVRRANSTAFMLRASAAVSTACRPESKKRIDRARREWRVTAQSFARMHRGADQRSTSSEETAGLHGADGFSRDALEESFGEEPFHTAIDACMRARK